MVEAGGAADDSFAPHEVIQALAVRPPFPHAAVEAARAQRAAVTPGFIEAIEECSAGGEDLLLQGEALLLIFHLLGEWQEKSAYRPLVALLRRCPEVADYWLGDTITETARRVLASVCDSDPQPLFELALDTEADEYARSAALEALAIAVGHGKLEAAPVALFLRDCFTDLQPQRDNFAWYGWQSAIALLGLMELRSLVKKAFDRRYIPMIYLAYDDFLDDLRDSIGIDGSYTWLDDDRQGLFSDAVAELHDWPCFSPEVAGEVPSILDIMAEHPQPSRNANRDVGRNDPCPCGSGRKFKKCCGG
jgi:hypothetical protein